MTTEIRDLNRRWVEAERAGDADTLDALTTDDYTVVGPVGFVLDKAQSLDRYRSATFVTDELTHDEVEVREYGDAAVLVAVHEQKARFHGHPANGRFRATQVAVRDQAGTWRLAGMHLSPIGGPPPFVPPETPALDHTIIWATDKTRSAEFLSRILRRPVDAPTGPFLPITLENGVTLDFATRQGPLTSQHYAFRISEAEFDAAFAWIVDAGVTYWADPGHQREGEINHGNGGRGFYFADPDGHNMELLTAGS